MLRRFFFFFNDTATTEIYTLSLHDALPIVAEKRPAAKIDAANCLLELWILSACKHGGGEAEFLHVARRRVVDRQESHPRVEGVLAPAFDAFVENGIGTAGFDMLFALFATRGRHLHHFAAPALDVAVAHTVRFEHFFDGVGCRL